jgi:hypothetical protein
LQRNTADERFSTVPLAFVNGQISQLIRPGVVATQNMPDLNMIKGGHETADFLH